MVVGPTKVKPRLCRSFDSAVEAAVVGLAFRPLVRRRLETPEIGGERTLLPDQVDGAAGVVDGGRDLAAMADDAGIAQHALDIGLAERSHLFDVEARKGAAEILALPEDGDPREAGLEALQAHLLEEPRVVVDRPAPFMVVIGEIEFVATRPEAAATPVGPGDQPRIRFIHFLIPLAKRFSQCDLTH
jgi:hypothetical protein